MYYVIHYLSNTHTYCRMDDYVEYDLPIVLQQNDAYCTQVQLQQNVSHVTFSSENHQQQQYVHNI